MFFPLFICDGFHEPKICHLYGFKYEFADKWKYKNMKGKSIIYLESGITFLLHVCFRAVLYLLKYKMHLKKICKIIKEFDFRGWCDFLLPLGRASQTYRIHIANESNQMAKHVNHLEYRLYSLTWRKMRNASVQATNGICADQPKTKFKSLFYPWVVYMLRSFENTYNGSRNISFSRYAFWVGIWVHARITLNSNFFKK